MSSDLTIRRIIVSVVSLGTGFIATLVILALLGTDLAEFGIEWVFVTIAIASVALIWLDYFLNTHIIPE